MRGRLAVVILAACGLGTALSGCGASQLAQVVDPVAKAATLTESGPGYRMAMTMTLSFSNPAVGTVTSTARGVFDRSTRRGAMTMSETVLGHQVSLRMRLAGTTAYMTGFQGVAAVAHGRPWLKIDFSRVLSAEGLGGIPLNGSDPRQFLDYLRAAGGSATRLGPAEVRGVATTHYRAALDLDRYVSLVPPGQRSAARHSTALLESALGSHSLPVDAWLDAQKRVRQMRFHFHECVSGQQIGMAMTVDLFDYGPQQPIALPPPSQTFDATPLLAKRASSLKLGC